MAPADERQAPSPVFTLRPIRAEDAEALNAIRRSPKVMEFTLSLPSERVDFNRRFLEQLRADDHVLVAEVEGYVVGLAGLHVQPGKRRHVGSVGMAVRDDFHGRGIGRALLEALLDIADNYLGLLRVELEVLATNAPAIHLYETVGFVHEGRKRKGAVRRGRHEDVLVMGRVR
jgi:putative acetyltransferase